MSDQAAGDLGPELPGAPDPWVASSMPAARPGPPYLMTEMISAEPGVAARLLRRLGGPAGGAASLARAVREAAAAGRPILVTGCGTSEHAAQAIAAILAEALATAGLTTGVGTASVPAVVQALEGSLDETFTNPGAFVIGVSHEGGTPATNRALEDARDAGATVALVTVSDRSPGASLAGLVVETREQDQSWCHTIGYVSPMAAALAAAGHLAGGPVAPDAARSLLAAGLEPDAVAATERFAAALANVERLVVVGSGADRIAARELVLKVEEGAHLPAAMRDMETLLHGHLAGMDERTGVVLMLTDGREVTRRAERARGVLRAVAAIGGPVGAVVGAEISDSVPADLTPAGRLVVPSAPGIPPLAASLLGSAVPLQLLTERLARARGVNPDPIRRDDPRYLRAAEAPEQGR